MSLFKEILENKSDFLQDLQEVAFGVSKEKNVRRIAVTTLKSAASLLDIMLKRPKMIEDSTARKALTNLMKDLRDALVAIDKVK